MCRLSETPTLGKTTGWLLHLSPAVSFLHHSKRRRAELRVTLWRDDRVRTCVLIIYVDQCVDLISDPVTIQDQMPWFQTPFPFLAVASSWQKTQHTVNSKMQDPVWALEVNMHVNSEATSPLTSWKPYTGTSCTPFQKCYVCTHTVGMIPSFLVQDRSNGLQNSTH